MASSSSNAVRGAYYPSWDSNFPPSSIKTELFTHIYYAFLEPDNVTFNFNISSWTATELLNFTSTLHAANPPVKTLFSIGGANSDTLLYARMASAPSSRKSFIDSAIEVARKYGFDGIDLDWQLPQNPQEMQNLGLLLDDWRAEVQREAQAAHRPPLLLTAAVYYSVELLFYKGRPSYPVASVSKNLDWVNVMCYDYHGSWDTSTTGVHAALFDPNTNLSSKYGLGTWIKAGVPRSKLIMGLPLYGRTWRLKDPRSYGIGAPAVGVGPGGGQMTFSEVEMFNVKNNATVVYDMDTVSTYSVVGTSWIGYDDERSTTVKVVFAHGLGIRGYFFWTVNGDHDWKISSKAKGAWGSS